MPRKEFFLNEIEAGQPHAARDIFAARAGGRRAISVTCNT